MLSSTVIICVIVSLTFSQAQMGTVRRTQYGSVRGLISKSQANSSIKYYSFKGIPYARPPLGTLRFKEPQPPKSWSNIKCTTQDPGICIQCSSGVASGSEDCLYLNVYIPITAGNAMSQMPVMVWIAEGATTGPDYFMEKPVIMVEVKYRVTLMGYFTTLDDNAKGNLALKDQVLALKWIQNNIRYFNGDRRRVTIFGNGRGAVSCTFHMLSPRSEGLFTNVIALSGSPLNTWAIQLYPMTRAKRLAKSFGIDTKDTREMVEELQKIDAATLTLSACNTSSVGYFLPLGTQPFFPIIEVESNSSFLTTSPIDLIKQGKYAKVPVMMGFNSQEGEASYTIVLTGGFDINLMQEHPELLIPESMNIPEDSPCLNSTMANITLKYFPDRNYTNPIEWIPYMSLFQYVLGTLQVEEYFPKDLPLYFYYFSYLGSRTVTNLGGVPHRAEEVYLWYTANETAADKVTRERMITLWTNFAATGNPTPRRQEILLNIEWLPVGATGQSCLDFNSSLSIIEPIPLTQTDMPFWDEQYEACGFPYPNPNK